MVNSGLGKVKRSDTNSSVSGSSLDETSSKASRSSGSEVKTPVSKNKTFRDAKPNDIIVGLEICKGLPPAEEVVKKTRKRLGKKKISTSNESVISEKDAKKKTKSQRKVNDKKKVDSSEVSITPKAKQVVSPHTGFKLLVNAADEECLKFGLSKGYNVVPSNKVRFNEHAISAMCRDQAILSVLEKEGKGKTKLKVLDWFGSARNIKFSKAIDGCDVEWCCAPNDVIQGDKARGNNVRKDLSPPYDMVVIQDVYQFGDTPYACLGSEAIKLINGLTTGNIYVLCRIFNGEAGADVNGELKEEMVWVRKDGLIVASPEHGGQEYAPHPDINWLLCRHTNGVDSSLVDIFGPYKLFRVSVCEDTAQLLPPQKLPEGDVRLMDIGEETLTGRLWEIIQRFFPYIGYSDNKVLVHYPTLSRLSVRFSIKIPNGQTLDAVRHATMVSLMDFEDMKLVQSRFPDFFERIVSGTAYGVLYQNRHRDVCEGLQLREKHYLLEQALTKMRGVTMVAPFDYNVYIKYAAIATSILAVVYRLQPLVSMVKWHQGLRERLLQVYWYMVSNTTFGKFLGFLPGHLSSTGHSLIIEDNTPWVHLLAEESLGLIHPMLKLLLGVVEFGLNVATGATVIQAVPALLMHSITAVLYSINKKWGFLFSLSFHRGFNLGAAVVNRGVLFKNFLTSYTKGEIVEAQSYVVMIPPSITLPAYQSPVTTSIWPFRGTMEILVDGCVVNVDEALELLSESSHTNKLFPILINNRTLWEPANSEKNLLTALLSRTHNDPFVDRIDGKHRRELWREIGQKMVISGVFAQGEGKSYELEECAWLMGSRGRRILEADKEDQLVGPERLRKTISLKWNETISARKLMGETYSIRPRAIVNLDPIYHSRMAPIARQLADYLHSIFDGSVIDFGDGLAMSVYFAAGYTQKQLSEIADAMTPGVTVLAISGDDSVGCWDVDGVHTFFECDQSLFDQSQDEGPVIDYANQWMTACGCPPWFCELVASACKTGYRINRKRVQIKGNCGVQMPTGITVTTTVNSMSTLAMYVYHLKQQKGIGRNLMIVKSAWDLGLTAKYITSDCIGNMTFLKGWWRQDVFGYYHWLPLPSAVIKLGKLLRDPLDIVGKAKPNLKKNGEVGRLEAIRECAFALASSYSGVPKDYPILGPFLETLKRLGQPSDDVHLNLVESWKPRGDVNFHLDVAESLAAIENRYGISPCDVKRVEKLLLQVNRLPAYIEDSVFDLLCDVDYA